MKRLWVLAGITIFGIGGCSSKEKHIESAGAPPVAQATGQAASIAPSGKTAEPAPVSSGARATRASDDPKYRPLSGAVRSSTEGGKSAASIQDESTRLLGSDPNDPVALNTLAVMQLRRGKTGAAKLLIARGLEKNPHVAALRNNLGVALLAEGDQEGAIVEFRKALQIDDHNTDALGNLGSIYAQAGDYTKAQPLLEAAYRDNKAEIAFANNYAITLRALKNYDGAARVYADLLKVNSRDVSVLINYAILLIRYMNKPKEGLDLVYKVKLLETQRKDVLTIANALAKKAESELK